MHPLSGGGIYAGWRNWLLVWFLLVVSVRAESPAQGPVLLLLGENDFMAGIDRHYTQGAKVMYFQTDGAMPGWLRRFSEAMPAWGIEVSAEKFGFGGGQSIFTPMDLTATTVVLNDRPYAGWLYGVLALQRRGAGWADLPTLEHFELNLGMIGPESLAEETQSITHSSHPRGWRNQLKTEPGLALKYERSWRWRQTMAEAWSVDLIPHAGVSLGNVETAARAGATLRFGWELPEDFGIPTIHRLTTSAAGRSLANEGKERGAYLFASSEGGAVGYTSFLDGNLFRDSHEVDKRTLVGEWSVGLVLNYQHVTLGYRHNFRSREFRTQKSGDSYGTLFIGYKF